MKNLIISILCLSFVAGCTGEIEYVKDFTDGKGIRYAGTSDTIFYLAGKDRLLIKNVLGADPNLVKTVIYWNFKKDSIVVNYDRAATDTVVQLIEGLPENTYSFILYNYDEYGNVSVPKYLTARTYGQRYMSGLLYDRKVRKEVAYSTLNGEYSIGFMDTVINSAGVNFEYTDLAGLKKNAFVDNQSDVLVLTDIDIGAKVACQTLYIPEPNAIDTFMTDRALYDLELIPEYVLIPKPYGHITLSGDNTPSNDEWASLSDEKVMSGYEKYSEVNYKSFVSSGYYFTGKPVWVTLDLGEKYRISRFRADFYYYKAVTFPEELELMAYTGNGSPPDFPNPDEYWKEPGTWYNTEYWKDWVVIKSFDANDTSVYTLDDAGFLKGYDDTFTSPPTAQYYRLRCTKASRGDIHRFSLSEVTFWRF